MSIENELKNLMNKPVSVAAWLTRDENKNGNGAQSYVSCGELELVDQNYGWEYRVVCHGEYDDEDTASLAFNACMVSAISTDRDGTMLITVILTDG